MEGIDAIPAGSTAAVVGTIMVYKGDILKAVYKRMFVDDTSKKETVRTRMCEFGIQCGSSKKGFRWDESNVSINSWLLEQLAYSPYICWGRTKHL